MSSPTVMDTSRFVYLLLQRLLTTYIVPPGAVQWSLNSCTSSRLSCVQGHVLQLPSVKAAMGLPSGPSKAAPTAEAETMSEQKAQNQQVPQPVSASGQTSEGTANGQPISTIGNLPRERLVDMKKLLTVSPAVQAMAARATDASAVIVKVLHVTVPTHHLRWHMLHPNRSCCCLSSIILAEREANCKQK